jgi:hypothetical protein
LITFAGSERRFEGLTEKECVIFNGEWALAHF